MPYFEAAVHVGGAAEAESLEGGGREARLIALLADDDDEGVELGDSRIARGEGEIGPPFEHVPRDDDGARDAAMLASLVVTANVDEHGPEGCAESACISCRS
jgi:hypothetical protein